MELMLQPLRKYAEFTGRARRSEFWLFTLFFVIVYIVAAVLGVILGLRFLPGLAALALLCPSIAVAFRRLHDTDRSAWWLLIGFIPLIGSLVLLYFEVLPGTKGPNRFGPDPKESAGDVAAAFS